jgi:hypothetical protein
MLPFMIDTLNISIGEELENSWIKLGHSTLERGAHVAKRLGGFDPDMLVRLMTVGGGGSGLLEAVMGLTFTLLCGLEKIGFAPSRKGATEFGGKAKRTRQRAMMDRDGVDFAGCVRREDGDAGGALGTNEPGFPFHVGAVAIHSATGEV